MPRPQKFSVPGPEAKIFIFYLQYLGGAFAQNVHSMTKMNNEESGVFVDYI